MPTIMRAALVDAARDINKVLELSPPIDVKKGVSELRAEVAEAATLLKDADPISDDTKVLVASLDGSDADVAEGETAAGSAEVEDTTDEGETPVSEKPGKKAAKKLKKAAANGVSRSVSVAKSKSDRKMPELGEFKPIRRGSTIHKLAVMAQDGKTLDEMFTIINEKHGVNGVKWWLCQYLRRHHGIRGTVVEGRKVQLTLPPGKKFDDCVTKIAA